MSYCEWLIITYTWIHYFSSSITIHHVTIIIKNYEKCCNSKLFLIEITYVRIKNNIHRKSETNHKQRRENKIANVWIWTPKMNWKGKPTMHHTTTTRHDEKITLGSNKSCDDHAKTQKMRLKFEKYFLHIWSWCTPENWWVLCEYVFLIVRLISLFINATRLMGYYLLVLKVISGICRCNFFFFFYKLVGVYDRLLVACD